MASKNTFLFGPANEGHRRTLAWTTIILAPLFLMCGQILYLLPTKLLGITTVENIETYPHVLHLIVGAFAASALIFTLWIRAFERRDLASAGLGISKGWFQLYGRGFGFGLLMAAGVVFAVRMLGGYAVEAEVILTAADLLPILILMFAFVLQAGTEEFIFRGWMMGRIAERYGLVAGVIINSIVFSLMHVDSENFVALGWSGIAIFTATTFLFAIFLSLLTIREKSIWGAAGWHASWNWMFITWFGLPTTGIDLGLAPLLADYMPVADSPIWLTGGTDGPEGSLFTPLILVVGCLYLARRLVTRRRDC